MLINYSKRLAEAGIKPVQGDSEANALSETNNGLYKAKLITARLVKRMGPLNWLPWKGYSGSTTIAF